MVSNKDAAPAAAAAGRNRTTSAELLKGERQIVILHEGQEYRLQITKNGKLLLTK